MFLDLPSDSNNSFSSKNNSKREFFHTSWENFERSDDAVNFHGQVQLVSNSDIKVNIYSG